MFKALIKIYNLNTFGNVDQMIARKRTRYNR